MLNIFDDDNSLDVSQFSHINFANIDLDFLNNVQIDFNENSIDHFDNDNIFSSRIIVSNVKISTQTINDNDNFNSFKNSISRFVFNRDFVDKRSSFYIS